MSFLLGLIAWTRLKGNAFTVLRVLFFTWVKKIKFLPMRFFQPSSLTITREYWHNQSILSFALDINNDAEKPIFKSLLGLIEKQRISWRELKPDCLFRAWLLACEIRRFSSLRRNVCFRLLSEEKRLFSQATSLSAFLLGKDFERFCQ